MTHTHLLELGFKETDKGGPWLSYELYNNDSGSMYIKSEGSAVVLEQIDDETNTIVFGYNLSFDELGLLISLMEAVFDNSRAPKWQQ